MRINIIGDILGTSGYCSHTRSLFNALYKIADVKLSTQLCQGWERMVNDAELNAITKQMDKPDVNLIVTTPHNWKLFLGTGLNCAYCVWEGSKVPRSFIDEMLNPKINLILVPSEHTKQAIMNTLIEYIKNKEEGFCTDIDDKIIIIPHGVDFSMFKSKEKKHDKFTYVINKGWRGTSWDRGGVQYLLKAFTDEFSKEDNVELIVKLNQAYINPQILQQAVGMLNLQKDKAPIKFFLDNVAQDKLQEFYNMGDIYVCPTRSESFDLGSAEAMACGLPVIVTGYGGQIEHMNEETALLCDYKLEEVKEDLMYQGIEWATIDIYDLRKKMRWAYEHQKEVVEMGVKAESFIKSFNWDKSAELIVNSIKSISG
jgi:hypothetical protein